MRFVKTRTETVDGKILYAVTEIIEERYTAHVNAVQYLGEMYRKIYQNRRYAKKGTKRIFFPTRNKI